MTVTHHHGSVDVSACQPDCVNEMPWIGSSEGKRITTGNGGETGCLSKVAQPRYGQTFKLIRADSNEVTGIGKLVHCLCNAFIKRGVSWHICTIMLDKKTEKPVELFRAQEFLLCLKSTLDHDAAAL